MKDLAGTGASFEETSEHAGGQTPRELAWINGVLEEQKKLSMLDQYRESHETVTYNARSNGVEHRLPTIALDSITPENSSITVQEKEVFDLPGQSSRPLIKNLKEVIKNESQNEKLDYEVSSVLNHTSKSAF